MSDRSPLSSDQLRALAPIQLTNSRTTPYRGETVSVSLHDFAEPDRELARQLYTVLLDLFTLLQRYENQPESARSALHAFTEAETWQTSIESIQHLGVATYAQSSSPGVHEVIHDVKGGSLQAVLLNLQLIELGVTAQADPLRLFMLTRDHLKLMRNAAPDLDPERHARDLLPNPHHIRLIIDKWDGALHTAGTATARVRVDCRFDGTISQYCSVFAALDRVLYNLINNAVQHGAGGSVDLVIFALDAEQPCDVRFVVLNQITSEHRARLEEQFDDQINRLFQGGFSTAGTGLGLRISAEFVADAYGLRNVEACVDGKYVGAALVEDYFVSWVHWPAGAD
jgi:signal transduction histidine kinase